MNLRPFEIILIAIFAVSAIAGLIALSMYKGSGASENTYGSSVAIWGTFDKNKIEPILSDIAKTDKSFSVVTYRQVDERSFEGELLNAIAEGNSPDLVLMPHTLLASYRSKFAAIPSATYTERTFRDTYVDGAAIFMMSDGVYGLPIAVDPLVLYYNRTLFANAGLALPPKTWEALLVDAVPVLTKADAKYTLSESAIGMGEFMNITHAKEILSMLFLQSGTSIVAEKEGGYTITLKERPGKGSPPAESALSFYTQFASPGSRAYSWNRVQPFDRTAFTNGTLAMYFGFGSERKLIEDANPNLSFDITSVPQSQGATALRDYGTFYALGIPKKSNNSKGAYAVALTLASAATSNSLVTALNLTPVHRSLYTTPTTDVYGDILRQSGLIARGWLDPSPSESTAIFKTMIEGITTGRAELSTVVNDAAYSLEALFR